MICFCDGKPEQPGNGYTRLVNGLIYFTASYKKWPKNTIQSYRNDTGYSATWLTAHFTYRHRYHSKKHPVNRVHLYKKLFYNIIAPSAIPPLLLQIRGFARQRRGRRVQ
jgi:hypothetical protein